MKPMEHYKNAVMHRVEDKKRARKRALRRTLAVCLPLCLCLSIAVVAGISHRDFLVSEDGADGMGNAAEGTAAATVSCGDTVTVIENAEAVYEAIVSLYDTRVTVADGNGSDTENHDVPESYYGNGALADSSAENVSDNGSDREDGEAPASSAPYYLRFHREDGLHEFCLTDNVLTDLASGESLLLTEEQVQALINGEAP